MQDDKNSLEGERIRRQLVGEPEKALMPGRLAKWLDEFRDMEITHVWGTYWTRTDLLDLRSRAIVSLTCLVSLGYDEELLPFIEGLIRNKVLTKIEIREVIMQCPGYLGYPKTLGARKCAQLAFSNKEL